jgi:hypothetical protein
MRLKSELYKKEQLELCDKIIKILNLSDNTFVLYEMDNNKTKQDEIIKLIPDLRTYFSFNNIKGIGTPEKLNRPWLSIIKHVCKLKYKITSQDKQKKYNDKSIRTKKYKLTQF